MPDDFEQELVTDIAEAEAIGEDELAAQWRLELNSYRAARKRAESEEPSPRASTADARREELGRRQPGQP